MLNKSIYRITCLSYIYHIFIIIMINFINIMKFFIRHFDIDIILLIQYYFCNKQKIPLYKNYDFVKN